MIKLWPKKCPFQALIQISNITQVTLENYGFKKCCTNSSKIYKVGQNRMLSFPGAVLTNEHFIAYYNSLNINITKHLMIF